MSSRSKGKAKETASSSYYPTQWSEWEWDEREGRFARYRFAGPDDYQYDYRPAASADPRRTQDAPSQVSATGRQPYTTSQHYTTSTGVSAITQSLAGASLGTSPALQPASQLVLPQGISGHIRTRNDNTTEETFDPHYKVHQSWEFKQYAIFKVLWAEPNGVGGDDNNSGTDTFRDVKVGNYNQKISHKVRRFLIIKPDHGFCLCLPISTYTNKGTNKRGIRADTHTVIYTEKKPDVFPGEKEKGLTMKPIKVKAPPRHKLDRASRLNYAKLYTVEYNVKVWFIGKVDDSSQWQLVTDYNRMHPPLVPPPVSTQAHEDTFDYAQGGSSSSSYRYPLATAQGGQTGGGAYSSTTPYSPASGASYPTDPFYGRQQPTTTSSESQSASVPPAVVYSSSPPGGYPSQPGYGQVQTSPQYQYASMTQPGPHSTAYPASTYTTSPIPANTTPTYQPAPYGANPAYSSAPATHSYDPTVPTQYPSTNPTTAAAQAQYQQPTTRPKPHHSTSYPDDSSIRSGSKKRSGASSSGRK